MNITEIKKDFAMFDAHPELIYLDSGATSLTPRDVVDAMTDYYNTYNANISRGVYQLCEEATERYENVRELTRNFIGATNTSEIIFTSGTTVSINILAHGLRHLISPTDTIAVTAMDHHANFIPWQKLAEHTSADFGVIAIDDEGYLDENSFDRLIISTTKILALPYVSNTLSTINPIKNLVQKARAINPNIIIVVDAAQAAPHIAIDVVDLDCDFLAFSAHKMCGPTSAGVLWGKKELLEHVEPMITGGDMITEVTSTSSQFRELPHRLEAGTPNIAGVIGLGAAITYLTNIGLQNIRTHEKELTAYALSKLSDTFGEDITIYGPPNVEDRSGVISFTLAHIHPHDIAALLDTEQNICVRAGNHCTMPLHIESLGIPATARASFYLYNDTADVDKLIDGLKKVQKVFTPQ